MTSPSSEEGRRATRPRFARPSSAARSCASSRSPRLGGTCLRVGCIPTKAWVQTAHALHDARETFAKLGVGVSEPQLDFTQAAAWKDGVVKQMTGGVAVALQGERRRVGQGHGPVHEPDHDRGRGRGGRHLQERDRRHRLVPDAPADPGARLAALRRLDGPPRADRGAAPARRPRRRHHRLRVRLDLRPLRQRGDDRRDAADADPAGGRGRGEGAAEGVQEARHRRACSRSSARGVEDTGDAARSCASATASRSRPT